MDILKIIRRLPDFKGKIKLGALLAGNSLNKKQPVTFTIKDNLIITIPNSIESIGKELLIKGIYEPETIKLISELSSEKSIFFDVGANIGAIALPVAKLKKCRIHCFEPSRYTYEYLEKNVKQNGLSNITLNNRAVHSINDIELQFFDSQEKNGSSSLACTYQNQPHYVVKTVSLDMYCKAKGISFIDVLKIDVQGFEIEVLKGAKVLLQAKAIRHIIFEVESWSEKQTGNIIGASQLFLKENGYQIYNMKKEVVKNTITEGSLLLLASPY